MLLTYRIPNNTFNHYPLKYMWTSFNTFILTITYLENVMRGQRNLRKQNEADGANKGYVIFGMRTLQVRGHFCFQLICIQYCCQCDSCSYCVCLIVCMLCFLKSQADIYAARHWLTCTNTRKQEDKFTFSSMRWKA